MTLPTIVDNMLNDTLVISVPLFWPEIILCVTIVLLLFVRLFSLGRKIDPFLIALIGSAIAFGFALQGNSLIAEISQGAASIEAFTGLLIFDSLSCYIRVLLLGFVLLFVVLSRLTGVADSQDGQDYFVLVLGATLGMCIMAEANHLITVFLGIEMASVPSYVLVGIVKGRRRAGEAALKYCIYGAAAAGVMLYGISLLAGLLGTAHLPTIATRIAALDFAAEGAGGTLMVLTFAALMILVGMCFKLAAVPFHFWCPDVFEGATAEVDAFLSIASKAAALTLLVRLTVGITAVAPVSGPNTAHLDINLQPARPLLTAQATVQTTTQQIKKNSSKTARSNHKIAATQLTFNSNNQSQPVTKLIVAQTAAATENIASAPTAQAVSSIASTRYFLATILGLIAIVTCTFGNITALGQTNIKRMLGYSTIAHAGYMIMAVSAALFLQNKSPELASSAIAALLMYLSIYLFMNLSAFAIVAFIRNSIHSEEIADYAGMIRSCPTMAIALACVMFSMIGMPPLAGFWGKLDIFMALYQAGNTLCIVMFIVAGLNTAIALVYYLNVAKVACIDPEPDTRGPIVMGFLPIVYVAVVTLPVVYLGILPGTIADLATQAGEMLFKTL